MKITELRDQQAVDSDKVKWNKLVKICYNGFVPSWHCFVWCVCAREHLPTFKGLWDVFVGEEIILETVSASYEVVSDLALIEKVRKGGKKAKSGKGQRKKEDSGSSN